MKEFVKDLARADDDGFAMDQDPDCWSDLWQLIKTGSSRFLRCFRTK